MYVIGLGSKTLQVQWLPVMQHTVRWLNQKKVLIFFCHPSLAGDILDIFPRWTAWFAICIVLLRQKWGRWWRGGAGESGGRVTFCTRKEERHWEQRNADGEGERERVKWRTVDVSLRYSSPLLLLEKQEKALVPYSQACHVILRLLQKNRKINSQTPINKAVMYPHFSFM